MAASLSLPAVASERITKTFKINEKGAAYVESSPYLLTLTSSDLKKYPKSVVTFVLRTILGRMPSAIAPADKQVVRLFAKRHYRMLGDNKFGRAGDAQVIFNRKAGTVFVGFVGETGKTFFYKEVENEKPIALGKLETE
ncbi:MAG: hypothetical protein HY075_04905 [Deltaproteobacteria bacterium]|nr:hypothetical protein [Deltaproteobacteria bacterium]